MLLKVANLSKQFGGVKAVEGLDLHVEEGEIVSVIGPNGAGKSTAFNLITGALTPDSGTVELDGVSIAGKMPYKLTRAGIARTFQKGRLFEGMSVRKNIEIALSVRPQFSVSVFASIMRLPSALTGHRRVSEEALAVLAQFGVQHLAELSVRGLAYGERRLVEVARSVATGPRLLMLDEPAAGLNSTDSRVLAGVLQELRKTGITVLLIEHEMDVVMRISDRVYVLDQGGVLTVGTPSEVQQHPDVIAAYLGDAEEFMP